MKTTAKMIVIVILLGAGIWLTTGKAQAHGRTHYEVFYHELSPYGTWINSPEFGSVWIPNVAPGFHPYSTSGYWANTIFGWTWVSYYPWGWAPFHYGRWYYDNWYGWVWVPGTEWGPAWVSWSYCDGYYGWAPLTPGFYFSTTYNIHVDIPIHHWVFIHGSHFGDRHQDRYHMGRKDNDRLYHNSKPILNTTVDNERNTRIFSGPEVREVRKASGRDFSPVAIRDERSRTAKINVTEPVTRTRIDNPSKNDRAPVTRETQVKRSTRNDNSRVARERANIQPAKKQNVPQVTNGARMEVADRKSPVQKQPARSAPKAGNDPRNTRNTGNNPNK